MGLVVGCLQEMILEWVHERMIPFDVAYVSVYSDAFVCPCWVDIDVADFHHFQCRYHSYWWCYISCCRLRRRYRCFCEYMSWDVSHVVFSFSCFSSSSSSSCDAADHFSVDDFDWICSCCVSHVFYGCRMNHPRYY